MKMKEQINTRILKDSNLIVQGNQLINARYKLSVQESRLLYAAMSLIKPEDEDFKKYKIHVSDLSNYLGLVGGNIYNSLRKVTHSLISKSIVIEDSEGWKEFPLLTFAEYEKSDNSITLQFHPEMRPFLLQQKQSFTQAKLQNLIKYGSSYTSRIYLFLRQCLTFKRRDILVEDLKNKLELDNYEYNDLKRRVLLPAKLEMQEYSDIRFELIEHKQNKKIHKLTFLIYPNIPNSSAEEAIGSIPAEVINQLDEMEKSFAQILFRKYDVSRNVGLALAKEHVQSAPVIFSYIDYQITKSNAIKNVGGYAVNVIKTKEYESFKDRGKEEFENFVQYKKIVNFDSLSKERQQEALDENQNNFQAVLNKMSLSNCQEDHLLFVLEIKDRDIERRAKAARKKIEENISNQLKVRNAEFLQNMHNIFLESVDKKDFDNFLSHLEIYSYSETEVVFAAPSKFIRDWVIRDFLDDLNDAKNLKSMVNKAYPLIKKVTVVYSSES